MLTLSLFWIRLRDAQLHWFEANNRSCISWACYSSIFYYSKILYIPSAARAGKVYLTKHFDILKWKAPRLLASPNPFPAERRSTQPPQLSQIGEEHVWKRDAKWPSNADRSAHPWVEKKPFGQLKSCCSPWFILCHLCRATVDCVPLCHVLQINMTQHSAAWATTSKRSDAKLFILNK